MLIQDLPEDILIEIFKLLEARDIARARLTCKSLQLTSTSKNVWLVILQRDILAQGLPLPLHIRPLELLTGRHCEFLAVHALRLRDRLTMPATDDLHRPKIVTLSGPRSITWVSVIQGRYALAASSDQSSSVLALWELSSLWAGQTCKQPLAEAFLKGPVAAGLVDIQDEEVIIVLELRADLDTTVIVLKLYSTPSGPIFTLLREFRGISHIRAFQGALIGFALHSEASLPSVLNWRTGDVFHLTTKPDHKGGAIAMTIDKNVVVVVTREKVQAFLVRKKRKELRVKHLGSCKIEVPIAFAAVCFVHPSPLAQDVHKGDGSVLRLCITSHKGIFVYQVNKQELLDRAVEDFSLSLTWSRIIPVYRRRDVLLPYRPSLDANSGAMSWIDGPIGCFGRRYTFRTLAHMLPTDLDSANAPSSEREVYELSHPDLPAMYAMGVYDYDGSLGIGIFGNYYGELAVLNVCDSDANQLFGCFSSLNITGAEGLDLLPTTPVPASFALPFPYCGPPKIPDSVGKKLQAFWQEQSCFPNDVPPAWASDALEDDVDSWRPYTSILPTQWDDWGWNLEHSYHFPGTPVPLVTFGDYSVFQAGGIHFILIQREELYVVHSGVTLREIMARLEHEDLPPIEKLELDQLADNWAHGFKMMWTWEWDKYERNRWKEMQERGGDIHPSLIEDLPEHNAPIFWERSFGWDGPPT